MSTQAGYVPLRDRLHTIGESLEQLGGHLISANELQRILSALVLLVEHGDSVLTAENVVELEDAITPERPEGWSDQNAPVIDPRDAEIRRLRAQLAGQNAVTQTQPDQFGGLGTPGPTHAGPLTDDERGELETLRAAQHRPNTATETTVEHEHGSGSDSASYEDSTVPELETLVKARGAEPTGTGADGAIVKGDLIDALRKQDAQTAS